MDDFLSLDMLSSSPAYDDTSTSCSETWTQSLPEGIPFDYEHNATSTGHFYCVIA
ncbi:hypothetical protein L226DRAFT_532945 [Lentinus tigrinus ALCF2SS1-7]|uniref:uncharacterized protein n=1 Tax=Lentinus tigrinus ALCF2SS1-7 TaxID=1328758 RepID=UPI00116621AA|nr:hypothetical protein L226DRAFT_532945 [Lentinus tigrinus ALCF2SS1-7]